MVKRLTLGAIDGKPAEVQHPPDQESANTRLEVHERVLENQDKSRKQAKAKNSNRSRP